MVITPTVTLTGTYVLWVTQNGTDIGSYALGVLQGLEVLLIIFAIMAGLYLALRVLP